MLKKSVFSFILAIFILGVVLLVPKNTTEFPLAAKIPIFDFLGGKKDSEITIILTGDIMLGRSVMQVSLSKNDPIYPFLNVYERLRKADLVFGNLEAPIVDGCPTTTSGMIFCADPKMILGLKFAGVDIVSLANNHTKNYGEIGFAQTQNFLTESGINFTGADNLAIKEIKGIRFGFLGFDFLSNKPKDTDYLLVKDSKGKVDVLIVAVHWGNEYVPDPTSNQKEIAGSLIESGADVIVGSHPHWVQGYDTVDNKPIFYSLGNFVFDQVWSEETKDGLAIRLTYQNGVLKKIEKMPIHMENFAQPKWVNK